MNLESDQSVVKQIFHHAYQMTMFSYENGKLKYFEN